MNSHRDILVAFQSRRLDISSVPNLEQVEVAFFENDGDEAWIWRETQLVGSVDYSPVGILGFIPATACERPDIIADEDKFFVSWTRRYEQGPPGSLHEFEPGVLECAWIEIVPGVGGAPSSMSVTGKAPPAGSTTPPPAKGYELDFHNPSGTAFTILECKGVCDSVVLEDPSDQFKVAVAYPHQKDFSNIPSGDFDRIFEVRVVTSTFDPARADPIEHDTYPAMQSTVSFNGASPSTGLILPDLAPSGEDNAFFMVTESQLMDTASGLVNGAVRLGYWELQGGSFVNQASRTYSSPMADPFVRRRPMISSYPEGTGEQIVALTFSKLDADIQTGDDESAQVITKTHRYSNGSITPYPQVSEVPEIQYFQDWPNVEDFDDAKPTVVRGPLADRIQFCLADQRPSAAGSGEDCNLLSWNQDSGTMQTMITFPVSSTAVLGRPAVGYHYEPNPGVGVNPHYIPVAWEAINPGQSILRCKIGVLDPSQ